MQLLHTQACTRARLKHPAGCCGSEHHVQLYPCISVTQLSSDCCVQTESLFMAVTPILPHFLAGIAAGAGAYWP